MSNLTISSDYVCSMPKSTIINEGEEELVNFHRHCQATVLSAYGPGGQGATWYILNALQLDNINLCLKTGKTWKEYFTKNDVNITEDLASILELIDKIALGMVGLEFKLKFTDQDNKLIDLKTLKPYSDIDTEYTFKIGRNLTLKVNGSELKFNSVKAGDSETVDISLETSNLNVFVGQSNTGKSVRIVNPYENGTPIGDQNLVIPQKTVQFKSGDRQIDCGYINVAAANETIDTITIKHDYCYVPCYCDSSGATNLFVKPVNYDRVYKYQLTTASDKTLTIDLSSYQNIDNDIVEFEYHPWNGLPDQVKFTNIYVVTEAVSVDESGNVINPHNSTGWQVVNLTDVRTIISKQRKTKNIDMIPNGNNPHGLEERTLTFHVTETCDGKTTESTKTTTDTLFCYAQFPQEIRGFGGIYWKDSFSSTFDEYINKKSYMSKKIPGDPTQGCWGSEENNNLYMLDFVNDGKTGQIKTKFDFYSQRFVDRASIPEYANVLIWDTSGSMQEEMDDIRVQCDITSQIWNYLNWESSRPDNKIYLYDGTYFDNISGQLLGTLKFKNKQKPTEVLTKVKKVIENTVKKGGTEDMISCLYLAIADIQKTMLSDNTGKPKVDIVSSDSGALFTSIMFVLYTDETLLSDSSFTSYDKIKTKFTWFNRWQTLSNNKFSTTKSDGVITVGQNLTNALKQMSHYYGISMHWAWPAAFSVSSYIGNFSVLNKVKGSDSGTSGIKKDGITYQYDWGEWKTKSGYHIAKPYESMAKIYFDMNNTDATLKSDYSMIESNGTNCDQFNSSNIMRKYFNRDAGKTCFGFRYFKNGSFSDGITLPDESRLDNVVNSGYKWGLYVNNVLKSTHDLGFTYIPIVEDVTISDVSKGRKSSDRTIQFKLLEKTYKINFNANGGSGTMPQETCNISKKYSIPGNRFTRENYTFVKWNTKPDGTGATYYNEIPMNTYVDGEEITLYAQWQSTSFTGGYWDGNKLAYHMYAYWRESQQDWYGSGGGWKIHIWKSSYGDYYEGEADCDAQGAIWVGSGNSYNLSSTSFTINAKGPGGDMTVYYTP